VLPDSWLVYVERTAALFVAKLNRSQAPIARPEPRSAVPVAVDRVTLVEANAVVVPGAVCRFVDVFEPPTLVSSPWSTSPVGSALSVTEAPSRAFVPFVFFQKNLA
jgi:hypothetical protein